ncbi:MAG TPA: glycosyltransferase family 39 protein [Anaerolineales bacterium]|nr:glycosyltransferase family 39 protein [Anaerolineales bacterium]
MILLIIIFLLPILTGGMVVHLLWPERDYKILVFKAFLGIGVGLGISSLLYFLYLLLFAGQRWFIFLQLTVLLLLVIITIWKERNLGRPFPPRWSLSRTQSVLIVVSLIVFAISLTSTASYLLRRKQGDWDAWMMFNRAARFMYRDQTHWLESFSRQMDPIFHADYPLLLALNTASGWDTLGEETPRVPMIQSALFSIGCMGLAVSALASIKSAGQAALGLIILWGTPALVDEGARELADVPLAFFILATVILIYFYVMHRKSSLLVLAGLTAGLAAWTKNEGSLFVIAVGIALVTAFLKDKPWHVLLSYAFGLAFPFTIVLYFKLFLAPPSDVLSNGAARSLQQIIDPSRHLEVLNFFWDQFVHFGSWTGVSLAIGVIPILLIYFLLFRVPINNQYRPAFVAGVTILLIQAAGDYGVYLISPYDLTWHLTYSASRIVLQIFPLIVFLILCSTQTPEMVFNKESSKQLA